MGIMGGFSEQKPIARLMAFIDGGYLREHFIKKTNSDIDYGKLENILTDTFNANCRGMYVGDLIRTYYYDAEVDVSHPKYTEQNEYHNKTLTLFHDYKFIVIKRKYLYVYNVFHLPLPLRLSMYIHPIPVANL